MQFDPLQDGKSKVALIDSMGSDLSVVNDAKASFDREALSLGEKEVGLIRYLVKESHTSPLRGVVFKFKIKAPLSICRQWWKHVIASNHNDEQLSWNEKSFRYVEIADDSDFYVPDVFRLQSKSNKQGSDGFLSFIDNDGARADYRKLCEQAYDTYKYLLSLGVAREEARNILPPAFYTTWVWTASLQAVLNFVDLRKGSGAQSQIQKYAAAVEQCAASVCPETLKIWSEFHHD